MPHTLAAHLGAGYLNAAAVADFALVTDSLILSAVAFPVLLGAENPLAEQAVPFRLESAVIYGLRLFYLAIGSFAYLLRGGKPNFY